MTEQTNATIEAMQAEGVSLSDEEISRITEADGSNDAEQAPMEPSDGEEGQKATAKGKAETAPEGYVPLGALQQERAAAREWRERYETGLAKHQEQVAAVLEKLTAAQTPKEAEPKQPSIDEDPTGYFLWQQEQLQSRLDQLTNVTEQQRQMQAQYEHDAAVIGQANAYLAEAAAKDPEIEQVGTFVANKIHEGLVAEGLAGARLQFEFNRRVAEQVRIAQTQPDGVEGYLKRVAQFFGYQPSAAPAKAQGDGERFAKLAQAQEANRSMRGSAPGDEVSLEALAAMDPQELEKFRAAQPEKFARLLAG